MSPKPLGRRPGPGSSRDAIVVAARYEFAQHGYDRATMRSIAGRADVDPATIYRFFRDKNELLAAAVEFPVGDDVVASVLSNVDGLSGPTMLRELLGLWQDPDVAERLVAMLRVAATHDQAGAAVSGLVDRVVLRGLVAELDDEDAELRAALVASQLAGLALLRLVIPLDALAGASVDDLAAAIGPNVDRYLRGDLSVDE